MKQWIFIPTKNWIVLFWILVTNKDYCNASENDDDYYHYHYLTRYQHAKKSSSAWRHKRIGTILSPSYMDDVDNNNDNKNVMKDRMSIANMTCDFFTQPLNHFVPRGKSPSYEQRYCIYTGYAANNEQTTSPILFYTGNESPLEQYINHTGLMWEIAPKLHARVVFVEHRYEGQSLPPKNLSSACLSYASTIQALADYAKILTEKINPGNLAPVIAFGGSYGGMLSGWMRMKYPHLVAGAIAASAPIGAFPQSANDKIDGSAQILTAGMNLPYPPNRNDDDYNSKKQNDDNKYKDKDDENFCTTNLLAAWPLITWLVEVQNEGILLQELFHTCDPVTEAKPLLEWAQDIWFDLAEGSFPYPSSYIPFALIHKKVDLPPWPLQAACWNVSSLYQDWGVRFVDGNVSDVKFKVQYGDSGLVLDVDWSDVRVAAAATAEGASTSTTGNNQHFKFENIRDSIDIRGLLSSVGDAASIWYNVTKDVECYDIYQAAPNSLQHQVEESTLKLHEGDDKQQQQAPFQQQQRTIRSLLRQSEPFDPEQMCHDEIKRVGSWEPLCCNDDMNLVVTEARGIGNDFFWPPTLPRGVKTYKDAIQNITADACPDPEGIYGYSEEPYDLWSTWLDTYYGGIEMNGHSNIIFSNGLLDPWSAGGVYNVSPFGSYEGPYVQNITKNDVIAVIIKYGGHHTDLMYSNKADPPCVSEARNIETKYISKWIHDWKYA